MAAPSYPLAPLWTRAAPHLILGLFCAGLASALAVTVEPWPAGGLAAVAAVAGLAAARAGRAAAALALLGAVALVAGAVWGSARIAATAPPALALPASVAGIVVIDAPPVPDGRGGARARGVADGLDDAGAGEVPRGTRLLVDLPARLAGVAPGTRLRVRGRLRAPAGASAPGWWRDWLARQRIAARLDAGWAVPEGRRGGLRGVRDRWRAWATANAGAGLSGDVGAVVRGMALGGGSGLSEEAADAFRDAGVWHLLAVSGQNVAVVALASLALLTALGVRRRMAVGGAAAVMVAYCLACDGGASVGRAGVVGGLALLAEARSSPRERWHLLLAGLAALLAAQPRALGDPGLQLSFAAVAGLFTLAPPLSTWLRGWMPGRVADLAGLAAAAGLATAPVVVWHFGRLSLVGLALNVVAVPLAAPVVVLALAGLAAGAVVPAAGVALAWIAGLGASALLGAARLAAALPGAAVDLPAGAAPALVAVAAAPLVVARLLRPGAPPRRAVPARALSVLAAALALAGWTLTRPGPPPPWPDAPMLTALDIGQGDALLLRGPEGAAVLVDAGPPGEPAPVVAALARAGVRRLDAVVLTHDSLDHVGGLPDILDRLPVGSVAHPPAPDDGWAPAGRPAFAAISAAGVPTRALRAGDALRAGSWRLRVLSPAGPRPAGADPNPYSLVALATAGSLDALLTADAESDALARLPLTAVDVLKVSHHGSEDAGLPAQLARLRPRVAVISAGEGNRYGHPRRPTLDALAAAGVTTWVTASSGDVGVQIRGGALAVAAGR